MTTIEPDRTDGFAIASLACGVVGVFVPVAGVVISLLAIAFGIVARRRIAASDGRRGGDGLMKTGIALGVLGVGLTLLLLLFAVEI